MSSIKNKNLLLLGAALLFAAAYGYYAYNTEEAPASDTGAKAALVVPASPTPVNVVEPTITTPAVKVTAEPVIGETVPSTRSLKTEETGTLSATPKGEQK